MKRVTIEGRRYRVVQIPAMRERALGQFISERPTPPSELRRPRP